MTKMLVENCDKIRESFSCSKNYTDWIIFSSFPKRSFLNAQKAYRLWLVFFPRMFVPEQNYMKSVWKFLTATVFKVTSLKKNMTFYFIPSISNSIFIFCATCNYFFVCVLRKVSIKNEVQANTVDCITLFVKRNF